MPIKWLNLLLFQWESVELTMKYLPVVFFVLISCSESGLPPRMSVIASNNVSVTIRESSWANLEVAMKAVEKLASERCGSMRKSAKLVSSIRVDNVTRPTTDYLFSCR